MAKLRCWKKEEDLKGYTKFKSLKGNKAVSVRKDPIGYRVSILSKNKRIKGEDFLYKSQALKFAKSYMRSHNKC